MLFRFFRQADIIKNRINFKPLFLFLLVFFVMQLCCPILAGVRDGSPDTYRSELIDHSVTPETVFSLEDKINQSNGKDALSAQKLRNLPRRTIFWTGRTEKFLRYPGHLWLLVKTYSGGYFWVYASQNVRNLDFDRTGYLVGVKGNIMVSNDRMQYVKAKSVVLIAPHDDLSYKNFIAKYNVPDELEMNTPSGKIKIKHRDIPFILHRIYIHNPHYKWNKIKSMGVAIMYYSKKFNVDPLLATALINIESAFDTEAISPSGAIGLGQLMPGTAAGLGVNPNDPIQNVGGAIKYLHYQLERWQGYENQVELALASYNAGPGAVSRYGTIPPYSETQNYIFFIKFLHKEYLSLIHI